MDISQLNYTTDRVEVSSVNYVENEEWELLTFQWEREEVCVLSGLSVRRLPAENILDPLIE